MNSFLLDALQDTKVMIPVMENDSETIYKNFMERKKEQMFDIDNLMFKQFAKENGIDLDGNAEEKRKSNISRCEVESKKKKKKKKKIASQSKKKNRKRR